MALNQWTLSANDGLSQRGTVTAPGQVSVVEAENICWLTDGVLNARQGFAAVALTNAGLTGEVQWMGRHVTNAGIEELWAAASNSGTPAMARRASGSWSTVSISDTLAVANLRYTHGASLNGKFFLAYDSDVNRLHVWDGTILRRVGLSKPAAPTAANTGTGTYAATARRYRVMMLIKSGSDVIAQSELSDALSFTPSGTGEAARVTKPTTVDSATHWRVYGLIGTAGDTYDLYEQISDDIAVGTTTFDDDTNPSSYDGDFPPALGTNIPPPSAKFIITDRARLIMAGAWETSGSAGQTAPKGNRVWFTRVLGASDLGDDESIPDTADASYWLDIGDAGPITGLAGPIYGEIFVFKERSVWKLVPTGNDGAPYSPVLVSDTYGAVNQRVIAMAEDNGRSCVYFGDTHALCKLSAGGALSPVGEGIGRDLRALTFTAAESLIAYDPYQRLLLVQTSATPTGRLGSYSSFVLDAVKQRWAGFAIGGGISGWTLGVSTLGVDTFLATGATLRAAVFGQTATGARRLLLAGQNEDSEGVITAWAGQCALDGASTFESRLRVRRMMEPGQEATFYAPTIWYRNPQGSTSGTMTLRVDYIRPDGESVSASTTLTATSDDSGIEYQPVTLESLQIADVSVIDVLVRLSYSGTAFTSTVTPAIDTITIPWKSSARLAA